MAEASKRKTKVSGSSESDISSPETKKLCENLHVEAHKEPFVASEETEAAEDQVLRTLNMTQRISAQLDTVLERLTNVETKLQRVDDFLERFSCLEKTVNKLQNEVNSLFDETKSLKEKVEEVDNRMNFANAELEALKKKDKENEDKIKELENKLLYQEVYNRRENLRFFGIPETDGVEITKDVMHKFFKDELEIEEASNVEFQRVHRIGKKKVGEVRPVIARFLKYPDREFIFRRIREFEEEVDVKVYADLPKEIRERRKKQWPKLKKAREEGKIAFFSKPEPDKLFIDGQHIPM